MKCLIYRSQAVYSEYDQVDFQILREALRRNSQCGITGFLHREGDQYFQYVEGPDDEIDRLLFDLMEDDRHHHVRVLDLQPVRVRRFSDWSMGYSSTAVTSLTSFIQRGDPGADLADVSIQQVLDFLLFVSEIQRSRVARSVVPLHMPEPELMAVSA